MVPIVDGYLAKIKAGMRVLDIGCGSWSAIKTHCKSVDAHYEGIDICQEYFGKPVVATRLENLANLSFPEESFDIVIGNQTMEHWSEFGCPLRWGLYQCFRVCKKMGRVQMNVPIHFHGTSDFLLGRIGNIERLFARFSNTVSFEFWGSPPTPIPPVISHPGYLPLRSKPAFVLSIDAVKDAVLPETIRGFSPSGRAAQLFNYPVSFNIYRLLRLAARPSKCHIDQDSRTPGGR